jgi:hypothetical protein
MSLAATLEQDRAAGGLDRRKMKIRSGEVVTVSLTVGGSKSPHTVALRFKSGGLTVNRPVGRVEASSRFEALKLGWQKVREEKIAEQNQWSWVTE